ncbi:MAG TPA: hypothetical protein IAB31_12330 [Candidatus Choladousia intestinavium]|uniref:Uncharacterized protein n=1 Tax=Candidatus Choladousia intestinavium TaxID=2840727 RepID=A0A9D1DBF2_9FIRM|nr:hypothetical protein [Candidatus Choladousia intestinavium]
MKKTEFLKKAAGHACIICSIVMVVIQILDWYNPFMDFMGHSMFVLYILCAAATFLGICQVYIEKRETGGRRTGKVRKR